MRRAAVLALFCCFAAAQSSLPPEVLLLSRIRRGVAATLARLPSYACLENIDRLARKNRSKRFRPTDTLRLEVIASGERELFSWPDSQFSSPAENLVPAGLTTSGEFYSSVKAVFLAGPAVIQYHGAELLNGVHAARYDYRVSQVFSGYRITNGARREIVGFSGSFWADPASAELLRLSESADNIPMDLHIRSATTLIDYSRVLLGGKPVRFPESARVDLIDYTGREDRNFIEFTHCREYQAESNIDFNTPAPELIADRTPTAPPVEFHIPAGLTFDVHLRNAVNFVSSRIGDPITAVVENDVSFRKHLMVPKGAALTGRLRLLTHSLDPASPLIVGLEFTDIDFTDSSGLRHHAPFYALLTGMSPLPGISREISDSKTFRQDLLSGFMEGTNGSVLDPPALPGVGTFFAQPPSTNLPKGFAMNWVTVRLDRAER